MKSRLRKGKQGIDRETAAAILKHHFGKKPSNVNRIFGGLANHVFEAKVGREDLIIRISEDPAKLQVYMKEQWAITMASKNKVPTPEILEVSNDACAVPYMISRKVSGRPASTIGRKKAEVLHDLGKYAAIINGIKTHDFGHLFDWSPNKLSRNRTWTEYLDNELKLDERIETFKRGEILDASGLKRLRAEVERIRRWKEPPSLSHGDIRLKNVILNEQRKIIAILDWEDCTSNIAPYWELSIALHDLSMDEKEIFLSGYGLDLNTYIEMAPSIKAINILNYAGSAQIALERKDKTALLSLRARLSGTFDLYSL